jgi:hypothetical protein
VVLFEDRMSTVSIRFLVAVLAATGACGRSYLDGAPTAATGGNSTAGTPGGSGSGAATGALGAGGVQSAGSGGAASDVCTPWEDETCGLTASHQIEGSCRVVAGSAVCECNETFSIDPKTGRCVSCWIGAGAAPPPPTASGWSSVTVDLPDDDCSSRPTTTCVAVGNPSLALQTTVLDFLEQACQLPAHGTATIIFSSIGCAVRVQLNWLGDLSVDPNLVACLSSSLSKARWTCTRPIECVTVEWDTTP